MRLFVAIELSEDLQKSMTATMHDLKIKGVKGNYVPVRNLHLTLAFLGEVADLAAVENALRGIQYKAFKLSLSSMGTFGDLLWVGTKGNQGLAAAAKSVREALDENGITYDGKKFTPHITIVRHVTGPWQQVSAPKGEMTVKKISLMKTTFKNGKPEYTEIFAI